MTLRVSFVLEELWTSFVLCTLYYGAVYKLYTLYIHVWDCIHEKGPNAIILSRIVSNYLIKVEKNML